MKPLQGIHLSVLDKNVQVSPPKISRRSLEMIMYNTMAGNSEPYHPHPPPPGGGGGGEGQSLIIQFHARFHSNRKMYGNYCSIDRSKIVSFDKRFQLDRVLELSES